MGKMIELTASDGHRLAAYLAEPATAARGAVVVLQEIFGVNSHIKSIADGFAADGYLAIAPAMFDRLERGVDLGYAEDDRTRGKALKARAAFEPALLDVAAARQAVAHAARVGIVGYCWGGFLAWMASARIAGLVCAVPYYGGGIPDHAEIEPRCPVMAHFGERDSMIPVDGVHRLMARHPDQRIFLYAADHGFNCEQRASFDAPAATLARARTLEFFRTHIG